MNVLRDPWHFWWRNACFWKTWHLNCRLLFHIHVRQPRVTEQIALLVARCRNQLGGRKYISCSTFRARRRIHGFKSFYNWKPLNSLPRLVAKDWQFSWFWFPSAHNCKPSTTMFKYVTMRYKAVLVFRVHVPPHIRSGLQMFCESKKTREIESVRGPESRAHDILHHPALVNTRRVVCERYPICLKLSPFLFALPRTHIHT